MNKVKITKRTGNDRPELGTRIDCDGDTFFAAKGYVIREHESGYTVTFKGHRVRNPDAQQVIEDRSSTVMLFTRYLEVVE